MIIIIIIIINRTEQCKGLVDLVHSEITIATRDFGRVTLVNRNIKIMGVASEHFE